MEPGYSFTLGWHILSFIMVFGALSGIGYLVRDANREALELQSCK